MPFFYKHDSNLLRIFNGNKPKLYEGLEVKQPRLRNYLAKNIIVILKKKRELFG